DAKLASMELALHDAQSVIAREYGFASFAELRAHVERALPTQETLQALMERNLGSPLPSEVQQALFREAQQALSTAMPEQPAKAVSPDAPLPLLPLRNAVLPVGTVAPLNIGRATSIAAIQAAQKGDSVLVVFSQKDQANEAPSEAELHPVGCVVHLIS